MAERTNPKIVPRLQQEQHAKGFLSHEALSDIAKELGVPIYQLYGVVTFFPHFRLEAPPTLDVLVCTDLTCRIRRGEDLLTDCEEAAAARPPGEVVVRRTSCLGRCDGAPALSINNEPFHGLDDGGKALCEAIAAGRPLPPASRSRAIPNVQLDPYWPRAEPEAAAPKPWAALDAALAAVSAGRGAEVIAQIKDSKLVGLGGAGFPAAIKWETVAKTPSKPKYVICNADESEPGTIKDRAILSSAPHLLIEGMAIAAVLTGAEHGYVYIRHEYEPEKEALDRAIEEAKKAGVLGPSVRGSSRPFTIAVFLSPGGYICGEETALMEAIEGRRAQPRLKGGPPPAIKGLFGQPTVINNVETFTHVPSIVLNGPQWYQKLGRNAGVGLKFMGISGDVKKPGVYELPMGTTLRELIDVAGGMRDRPLKAFVPSGASSGVLPASDADVPLDWGPLRQKESMLGSSAVIILDDSRCMVDVARNIAQFFARESCGKCWPCRVGSEKIADMLDGVAHGSAPRDVLAPLDDLAHTLLLTSICGLGMVVPNPIVSVRRHFPDEVRAHVERRECWANVCPMK